MTQYYPDWGLHGHLGVDVSIPAGDAVAMADTYTVKT